MGPVLIAAPSHDAAENLAAEEFLLTHYESGSFLMLWSNDPCVVIGKFQNPYEEVSLAACRDAGISVIRRNSGGGTVYHDRGNLNYTILTDRGEDFPDYERFLTPVVEMLRLYGVEAEISDTSAMTVNGRKFSGNAQSNRKNRIMHHGTLLFDADLDRLNRLTGHARGNIVSRAVKSQPSPVTNLRPLLKSVGCDWDYPVFAAEIANAFSPSGTHAFTEDELSGIRRLADLKYRSWEWNYGMSPAFRVEAEGISLTVERGMIVRAEGDLIPSDPPVGMPLTLEGMERVSPLLADVIFG